MCKSDEQYQPPKAAAAAACRRKCRLLAVDRATARHQVKAKPLPDGTARERET